jgi:hypothetical protein
VEWKKVKFMVDRVGEEFSGLMCVMQQNPQPILSPTPTPERSLHAGVLASRFSAAV